VPWFKLDKKLEQASREKDRFIVEGQKVIGSQLPE
jgi:hypothetical protein